MQYVRADSISAEAAPAGELEDVEICLGLERWRCCWDRGCHLLAGFMCRIVLARQSGRNESFGKDIAAKKGRYM